MGLSGSEGVVDAGLEVGSETVGEDWATSS